MFNFRATSPADPPMDLRLLWPEIKQCLVICGYQNNPQYVHLDSYLFLLSLRVVDGALLK